MSVLLPTIFLLREGVKLRLIRVIWEDSLRKFQFGLRLLPTMHSVRRQTYNCQYCKITSLLEEFSNFFYQ
jgi:hypothetical protein